MTIMYPLSETTEEKQEMPIFYDVYVVIALVVMYRAWRANRREEK